MGLLSEEAAGKDPSRSSATSITGLRPHGKGRNTALLGIAALVLIVVVWLSYRELRRYRRADANAAQTRAILDSADRLLATLIDAQAGQRGFLLTGEERYFERYNQSVQEVPAD